MRITTDKDITGPVAKALRQRRRMTQAEFWSSVGVTQSVGSKYESGLRRVPQTIRSMIFIRYVAGILADTSTKDGAAKLVKLAAQQPQ